jgi:hypothetical protein
MSDNTMDLIIGKKTGLKHSTLVYAVVWYTFIILIAAVVIDLVMLIYCDEILDTIAFSGLTVFFLIIFLFENKKANIFSRMRKKKLCEEKENKFKLLPPNQQEEIIQIAECYEKVKLDGCNKHYVWGTFEKVKKSNALWGGEPRFEYIPYTDITWVHMINIHNPLIFASSNVVSTWDVSQKSICIYTYNGECYRFKSGLEFYRHLREAITIVNPECKFGYTKELKKEYKKSLKIS